MDNRKSTIILLILQSLISVKVIWAEQDVAFKKPTEQSSRLSDAYSWRAVNGKTNTVHHQCATTKADSPSWWFVDIADNYVIRKITLANPSNAPHYLANVVVEVSEDDPRTLPGFPGRSSSPVCLRIDGQVPAKGPQSYECDQPVTGRFIRVFKYGSLSICKFEAFGDKVPTAQAPITADTNLALKKPAYQSSDYIHGFARLATDGDRNGDFGGKSCTHTDYEQPHWWYVDLQDDYVIGRISITNRFLGSERLNNFAVEVSMADPRTLAGFPGRTSSPVCRTFSKEVPNNGPQAYDCEKPIVGRYVRVAKMDSTRLTICEFEVYLPAALPTTEAATTTETPTTTTTTTTPTSTATILDQSPVYLMNMTDVPSVMQCVRHCTRYTQKPCRLIEYHTPSGLCQLLHSTVSGGMTPATEWLVYVEDRTKEGYGLHAFQLAG